MVNICSKRTSSCISRFQETSLCSFKFVLCGALCWNTDSIYSLYPSKLSPCLMQKLMISIPEDTAQAPCPMPPSSQNWCSVVGFVFLKAHHGVAG